MNTLVIEKQTGGYFKFTLNGDTANAITSIQNDLLAVGTQLHFKTGNGANIIKEQFIYPADVTIIASGTFTFTTVAQVWDKLIDIDYFAWLGGGGTGGVDRFDDLLDTFSYTGNAGKAVVVDGSELRLVPITLYNKRLFTELEDTPSSLVPNKMLVVNPAGTAVVLQDQPEQPEQLLNSVGYFDYNDLITQTTPLNAVANVALKLTNDTEGANTSTDQNPYGVSYVWDYTTNQFNFNELEVGDTIDVRVHVQVTTTSANQRVLLSAKFGIGSIAEFTNIIYENQFKSAGLHEINFVAPFYMGSTYITDNPAELYLTTDSSATVKVDGWYVRILRKNINIITVDYTVPDATTTVKGIVRLAGDLAGTANSPTVPELANKVPTSRTVSTTSPLLGGGALSSNLTLSIQQANSVDSGYLSNGDWSTFNGKANDNAVVKLTGDQTISGVKTFSNPTIFNSSLNIASGAYSILYNPANSAYWQTYVDSSNVFNFGYNGNIVKASISNSGNFTANSFIKSGGTSSQFLKADGSVDSSTYALTSQLHDAVTLGTTGVLNGLSLSGQVLSLATASSTTRGALTAEDYSYFFGKQNALTNPITGTGTTNYLPKFTGASAIGNSLIYDDGTNIGIGTTSPLSKLHIEGDNSSTTDETVLTLRGNGENGKRIDFRNAFGSLARITGTKLAGGASADEGILIFETAINSVLSEKMRITSGGNVGIGTTSPAEKLDVAGNGSFGISGGINNSKVAVLDASIITKLQSQSAGDSAGVVGTESNNDFKIITNNTERMRITSGGNVGIGTTAPSEKLTVSNGKLALTTDDVTIGGKIYGYNDTSVNLYSGGLKFQTRYFDGSNYVYSDRLTLNSSGNVGIGTTSPGEKLDVNGNLALSTSDARFKGGNTSGRLIVSNSDTSSYVSINGSANGTPNSIGVITNSEISFNTGSSYAERMRITSGGNVGIGTSSPNSNSNRTTLTLNNNTWGGQLDINVGGTNHAQFGTDNFNSGLSCRIQSQDGIVFNAGGATERMRITSGGNVGIGTTSPDIFSRGYDRVLGLSGSGITKIELNGSSYSGIDFGQAGTRYGEINVSSTNFDLGTVNASPLYFQTNGSYKMAITSGGNVLIGTTTDNGYKLDVNGSARFSSAVVGTSNVNSNNTKIQIASTAASNKLGFSGGANNITEENLYVWNFTTGVSTGIYFQSNGTITASGGFFNSDMRLKDLTDYDYNVSDIKPITYLWKDGRDNKKHVGYSAQEVQKVMPDAVNEDEKGFLSVNYVEVLVAKIAELENRIKQLEK